MIEKLNYISDDELERLIYQVEQEELVTAPPDLMESVLEAVELAVEPESLSETKVAEVSPTAKITEFRAYCFRVITSVAAAVALVFLLPELTDRMNLNGMPTQELIHKSDVVGTIPIQAEVVKTVPDKATVISAKPTPSKEEVLDDTGFIEKVIINTAEWLSRESKEQ